MLTRLCHQLQVVSLHDNLVLDLGGGGLHSIAQSHCPRVLLTEEVPDLNNCSLLTEDKVDWEVSIDGTHLQLVALGRGE